jgi:hypothetical protein
VPVDLHYICKRGENHRLIWTKTFDTGNWTAREETCGQAIDGRIFLHENQKAPAWHGGTIAGYRAAKEPEADRKIFTYVADVDYGNVTCPVPWAQERAVAWWNEDRTICMSGKEFLNSQK